MALTKDEFDRMRADRASYLREIASITARTPTERARVADLKREVAEIERILYNNREPFGA